MNEGSWRTPFVMGVRFPRWVFPNGGKIIMADDNKIELSRRKVLGSLGLIGGAGAFAGAGTFAFLSDQEDAVVSFMSGKLDLTVHYESTYYGAKKKTKSGTIGGSQGMLFDWKDLKSGDHGKTKFCFDLKTNPAYLWLCGDIIADSEAGKLTEQEKENGDTTDDGELDEAIKAKLRYCKQDGTVGDIIVGGEDSTLRDVLTALENGIPLDSNGNGGASAGEQDAYDPGKKTGKCVCIEWRIPEDVDNKIQADKLKFSLIFHAVQARHNDGTGSPCDGDSDSGGDNSGGNKPGISYIAFCDSNGDSLNPTVTVLKTNTEGDPIMVKWETNKPVGHVALKTGNQDAPGSGNKWESYFDHFSYPNAATSGTVTVGTGTDIAGQTPSDPCPNSEEVKVDASKFNTS